MHEPVDQTGTSPTPHVDNPVEIYAGLLYMKKPEDTAEGGNFTIHRQINEIQQVNKSLGRQVDDNVHEEVVQVPHKQNSFCMFLNVMGSIHSVTPRIQPTERRRSINIIGEFNGNGKMWKVKEPTHEVTIGKVSGVFITSDKAVKFFGLRRKGVKSHAAHYENVTSEK